MQAGTKVTGGSANATTVNVGSATVTGTYALANCGDILDATDGANIAGVNAGVATTAERLTLAGAITMTAA